MTYQDLIKFIKRHLWTRPNLTIDIRRHIDNDDFIEVKVIEKKPDERNNN